MFMVPKSITCFFGQKNCHWKFDLRPLFKRINIGYFWASVRSLSGFVFAFPVDENLRPPPFP
jgi:hypothetical protein